MTTQHQTIVETAAGPRAFLCSVRPSATTSLFLGECPSLDLVTQGRTYEEATRAINDGVRMYVLACFSRGLLA